MGVTAFEVSDLVVEKRYFSDDQNSVFDLSLPSLPIIDVTAFELFDVSTWTA